MAMYRYCYRVIASLSLLINALAGGRLYETICARAWRLRSEDRLYHGIYKDQKELPYYIFDGGRTYKHNILCRMWYTSTIMLTDVFEKGHCRKAAFVYRKLINNKQE